MQIKISNTVILQRVFNSLKKQKIFIFQKKVSHLRHQWGAAIAAEMIPGNFFHT